MTLTPEFTNAQPVNLKKPPVVLRFKGLWPRNLRRFKFHDERRGGDLSHVDGNFSGFNEVLFGDCSWDQVIRDEIEDMRQHNFDEHVHALKAKSRHREAREVEARGPVVPWRASEEGPLREGILTVNNEWFGGSGQKEWDPERVAHFRDVAEKFLTDNFSEGQLRYASAHLDEEAYHIHFVVAVWTEKLSANRGHQILLQPYENPLIKSYEHAQDLAGEAFETIGIARGERRAAARRKARAEGKPLPAKRNHVPPSQWRAEERRKARAEAEQTVGDATVLARAAVKKSRKRAIKEALAHKKRAAQETAAVKRSRDAAEAKARQFEEAAAAANSLKKKIEAEVESLGPKLKRDEERAEEAADKYRAKTAAWKMEEEKLAQVMQARAAAAQELAAKKKEVTDMGDQALVLKQRCHDERAALAEVEAERVAEEQRLEAAKENVQLKVDEAEVISDATETGLKLIASGTLRWKDADTGGKPSLAWGGSAPKKKKERSDLQKVIGPAMPMIRHLAQLVSRTVQRVLEKERQKLREEAEYVFGLRETWEPEKQTRLKKIMRSDSGSGPA